MSKTLNKNENLFTLSLEAPQHPEGNESFLRMPSKVEEVIECLKTIENANKMDSAKTEKKTIGDRKTLEKGLEFMVTLRNPVNTEASYGRSKLKTIPLNTNQFTFMRQIEPDPEDRILARKEREIVADTFRRLGNFKYRKRKFEVAIDYYTKGLTYIKDTPVLYVNRAMCYIKLREYKRGIMDCDYIITNIDEKYLRAWLYRATAYKRLDDEANYENSVYQARRLNYTEAEFIDDFLEKVRTLL